MELPVDCSKSKYDLFKELHKIGDVKNRELPKRKKRYPKSKGAPKHPLSSYTHFLNDHRERVREDSPDMSNKELNKKLASEWSQLGQEEKQKYVERADLDKKRYHHEFLEYQKTDNYKEFISQKEAAKNGIKGKIRGPGAPKWPLSGYAHFLNDHREEVRKEWPDMPFKEISKKLNQKWSLLGQEEKQKYAKVAVLDQGQLQRWTEHSTLIFENLKPVEISK